MKANSKDRTAFTLVSSISIVTLLQTGKGNIDSKSGFQSLRLDGTKTRVCFKRIWVLFLGPRGSLVPPLSLSGLVDPRTCAKNLDQLYSYINHHRTTTAADAADTLMLLMRWYCWCCLGCRCADAVDTLMLLMHWCCLYCWSADAADALMLLMHWCCWNSWWNNMADDADTADEIIRLILLILLMN